LAIWEAAVRASVAFGVIAILLSGVSVAADTDRTGLVTTIAEDTIELTVPVSALTLTFPKGDLAQVDDPRTGAQASPRYFHFADARRGLNVSGWIESAASFGGAGKFWSGEFSAMKQSGLIPKEPPMPIQVGGWSGASYDLDASKVIGKGVDTHIRAELVQVGTWVDLHVSVTADTSPAEARSQALEFLKSIVVKEKRGAGSFGRVGVDR
jgi:hypothetical protein